MNNTEVFLEPNSSQLSFEDQAWLESFGVDPSWHDDPEIISELNDLVALGSKHLNSPENRYIFQEIVFAREKFFNFLGIDETALYHYRKNKPTIIPIDTFIESQRNKATETAD